MGDGRFFIEVDSYCLPARGVSVAGEVCLQRRNERRSVIVMARGSGKGAGANIMAEMMASMAMNYTMNGQPPLHAARVIIETFATGECGGFGFTIIDFRDGGEVNIAQLNSPEYILVRGGEQMRPHRRHLTVKGSQIFTGSFTAEPEDRIIVACAGVTEAGANGSPGALRREGVAEFCARKVSEKRTVSASELCREVVDTANRYDMNGPSRDMTCAVAYFRQPRRILVCSGPPYNEKKDGILADMVAKYPGSRLICGGTTAKIIARELGREINVTLKHDPAGLPPTSSMEGVDLVTEGVLTLSKVKRVLENAPGTDIEQKGTDGRIARMLLDHDIVEFVVGTRINPIHQDPDLPVELELRRNLIREVAAILENKFMKEVKVQYI